MEVLLPDSMFQWDWLLLEAAIVRLYQFSSTVSWKSRLIIVDLPTADAWFPRLVTMWPCCSSLVSFLYDSFTSIGKQHGNCFFETVGGTRTSKLCHWIEKNHQESNLDQIRQNLDVVSALGSWVVDRIQWLWILPMLFSWWCQSNSWNIVVVPFSFQVWRFGQHGLQQPRSD